MKRRRHKGQHVIFRKWRGKHGDVLALLPGAKVNRGMVMTYEHLGQHGEGEPSTIIRRTRVAKPSEYKELLQELKQRGYRHLRPTRRLSRKLLESGWVPNPAHGRRRRGGHRRRRG